ncbi:MAG: tetratricopeptide repeat protein [Betaproteobacteria bacterium]|nr:tetratricopeptide repeat protein [Betaproteobacteria bacterium]
MMENDATPGHALARLLAEGKLQPALDGALDALKAAPEDAELHNLAGICASRLGHPDLAQTCWERAISLNPAASQPHFNLGVLRARQGRREEAEACQRQAVALDPGNLEALIHLGVLLLCRSTRHEAEDCFRRAMGLAPGDARAYANLALLMEGAGRLEEAAAFHAQAVVLAPTSVEVRFNAANFWTRSGTDTDLVKARSAFMEVIRLAPGHFGAWNNLGNLLFDSGFTSGAKTAYTAAAVHHPTQIAPHVNLGNLMLYEDDPLSARTHFAKALALDPDLPSAHQGLASACHRQGDLAAAREHRERGFRKNPVSRLPFGGHGKPLALLLIASALEGNVPWRFIIDRSVFDTTIVAAEYLDLAHPLPAHDLVFNAIGDVDLCAEGLETAGELLKRTDAPVINRPQAVARTGRLANSVHLGRLPGVVAPRMRALARAQIADMAEAIASLGWPCLLRAPGFHGGRHFVRVAHPDDVGAALGALPGDEWLAAEFLDPKTPDGLFRKYRVMAIDGALYPLHLAISRHWKVHYFSSDMAQDPRHRQEEAAFLGDFEAHLGADAVRTLRAIARALELDYCGIDFCVDHEGRVMLFEANATMTIVPPTHETQWDYKRKAVQDALHAARTMFRERARQTRQQGR